MASQRTRSTNLQTTPVPNPVTQRADRSVVSELTTPSPPARASLSNLNNEEDDGDFDNVVGDELEKDENGGDGGDSDEEGEECLLHFADSDEESETESERVDVERKDIGKSKCIVDMTDSSGGIVGNVIFEEGDVCRTELNNLVTKDVKIYKPPTDWTIPMPRRDRDEPEFEEVDNPGNWPQYCFRPKYKKGPAKTSRIKYSHHQLPTGAVPVPLNEEGKRVVNGWELHYNGWTNPGTQHRRGATTSNMFPEEMKGCLDADVLAKLGLNEKRMGKTGEDTDALFFYQLILPICRPAFSGVQNDPRKSYYHDVEGFTNSYKYASGMGGSYGHTWKAVNLKELTIFDGILVRDGVLGGSRGAIHRRWEVDGPCYDSAIAKAMTLARFGEIKRSLKLCNNYDAPKRGQGKYEMKIKHYDIARWK